MHKTLCFNNPMHSHANTLFNYTGLAEICTSYSYLVQPYVDPPCNPVLSSESTLTLRCVVQAKVEVNIFWLRNDIDITSVAADDIDTWTNTAACDPGYMCTQSELRINNRHTLPDGVTYRCAIFIPGVEGTLPPSEGFAPDHDSNVGCGLTVYTNETKCVQPEIIINVLSPTSTAEYHQQSASSQTKTESTTQLPSLYHVSSVTSSLVLSPTTPSPTISGSTEYSHTASETVTSATQQGSSSEVLLYATVGVVGGLLMIIVTLVVTIATTCVYIPYLKKRSKYWF